ncbi:MAG: hypothetical protein ABIN48_08235 [Ginsengibacter sp.]
MNHSNIKEQILKNIDLIEDESQLQMLHDITASYAKKNPQDIIDFLPPEQLVQLEKSLRQAKIGNTHSHEGAKQIAKQWLGE